MESYKHTSEELKLNITKIHEDYTRRLEEKEHWIEVELPRELKAMADHLD